MLLTRRLATGAWRQQFTVSVKPGAPCSVEGRDRWVLFLGVCCYGDWTMPMMKGRE